MRGPTRRSVLAAMVAATGLPAAGCGVRVGRRHAETLTALVAEAPGAAAVGRAYLATRSPTTPVELAREIHEGLGPLARFDSADELRRRVARRIAAEVENGSFVSVAGWSLPPTEARLGALVALASD